MNRMLMLAIVGCLSIIPELSWAAGGAGRISTDHCELTLQSDIAIRSNAIEIATDGGDRMTIDDDDQLSINGRKVDLDADEQALVDAYAAEVRRTIPAIVAIAMDGVEIALTAVTEVFYGLSDDGPPQSLVDAIDNIEEAISARMYQDGTTVRLAGGDLNGLEAAMEDLEPVIEQAVSDALGDMMVSIGESLKDGDTSLVDLMSEFSEKQQRFERDIEVHVTARAEALEVRANALCDQVYALQAAESSLQMKVPETRRFDLVTEG